GGDGARPRRGGCPPFVAAAAALLLQVSPALANPGADLIGARPRLESERARPFGTMGPRALSPSTLPIRSAMREPRAPMSAGLEWWRNREATATGAAYP